MKNLMIVFIVLGICIIGSTSHAIHETIPAETMIPLPSAQDPAAVYRYIMVSAPYEEWDLWPNKGRLSPARQPHGSYLTTYINTTAALSVERGQAMRPGAIIVSEAYTAEKKLEAINVMYKVIGYNQAAGDWFWAEYGSDGSVRKAGRVQECISCHTSRKGNDFIMTEDYIK